MSLLVTFIIYTGYTHKHMLGFGIFVGNFQRHNVFFSYCTNCIFNPLTLTLSLNPSTYTHKLQARGQTVHVVQRCAGA